MLGWIIVLGLIVLLVVIFVLYEIISTAEAVKTYIAGQAAKPEPGQPAKAGEHTAA